MIFADRECFMGTKFVFWGGGMSLRGVYGDKVTPADTEDVFVGGVSGQNGFEKRSRCLHE